MLKKVNKCIIICYYLSMSSQDQNEGLQTNERQNSQRVSQEKTRDFSLPQIAGPHHTTDPNQLSQRGKHSSPLKQAMNKTQSLV